ncbi:hypothetical protein BIW11_12875 [Tropilaelaps mercedesae]|uniref:TFIIS N-terminal domain-containing protein n=1 Tax=Tropilaelaps mercedesae TaxID=418985 RepID=A0A1V9X5E6_9ACAR|nr:hypothetical protein BIW11_12875 [Tropilaelaps mercedesae]
MSSLDKIKQYCRRLENHPDDKLVLKETLHKLNKMEVTVDILQKTGIGKVVSCIKKRNDTAGVMAIDLIRKWRKVVDRETEMENPSQSDGVESDEQVPLEDVKHRRSVQEDVKAYHQRSEKTKEGKRGDQSVHSDKKDSYNKSSSNRYGKSSSEKVPEPELFSDAAITIKREIKEESSRHPKESSHRNSSASSKEARRQHHQSNHSHGNKNEDASKQRASSQKDESKNYRDSSQHKSHHKTTDATSRDVKEAKREKEIGLEIAPQIKIERHSAGHGTAEPRVSKPAASTNIDSSSIKRESNSLKDRDRRNRKRKATEEADEADGMNAENFGSFEDCLGSIDPKVQKKKRKLNGSKSSAAASPKMTVTSSTLNGSISKPKGPRLPDLLDTKKVPETHDGPLPMLQLVTDYKPLPRVEPKSGPGSSSSACVSSSRRTMTNEEAVLFTTSRKDRTAVYSGRRQHALSTVPTLYEACVRVLTEHVDLIEETGGVPFDIMRPIMERCTWQQLYRLEYYNPNLAEDSDPLWETHVKRDFRGKTPAKGEETWRELYLRCHDEREQKLKDLKESISQSMKAKQAPVRMTKLAYVDSVAKPPRNVQRAQLKHGTNITNRAKPSQARSIVAHASTSAATEPVRAPANSAPKKAKPAPLMAKTLMFMKMRKTTGYGFASR